MLFQEQYLINYSNLLDELIILFPELDLINNLINEDNEKKVDRGRKLSAALHGNCNYENFTKSKIKVFSHKEKDTSKISESLFGKNLTLKKIFNNQSDEIKVKLWKYLHDLVGYIKNETPVVEPINSIEETIKNTKEYIAKILESNELNEATNDMINDIIKAFENAFESGGVANPFESIMKINELITNKYKDKIENGEIDLNLIMDILKKSIPGLSEMNGVSDLLNMFNSPTESKEKIIMDENFSTADIEVGKEDANSNFNIGSVLKIMNSLPNMLGDNQLALTENGEAPSMDKLFSIFSKLNTIDTTKPNNLQNLVQKELGLDLSKISEQMASVLNKKNM